MSLWALFISLAVVGSFAYTAGMKFGAPSMSPFGYALIMNIFVLSAQTIIFFTAKYGFKVDVLQGVNAKSAQFAVLTGAGAVLVDLCFFLALRYGSVISSQIVWTVGSIIAMALFSAWYFGEAITLAKALGIGCGIASVILLTKAS
jgi:uncharacterized membrane protein